MRASSRSAPARARSPAEVSSHAASRLARTRSTAAASRADAVAHPRRTRAAVAEDDPGPAEAERDPGAGRAVVAVAPLQGRVHIGPLGPGEGEAVRLGGRAGRAPRTSRRARRTSPRGRRRRRPRSRTRAGGPMRGADAVEEPAGRRLRAVSSLTRERSTSRVTVSSTEEAGTSRAARTRSRASSVAPPGKQERAQQPALVVGEQQLVAPVEGRLQGLAGARARGCWGRGAVRTGRRAAARSPRPGATALGRCGELDRQRQAVQRTAHLLDQRLGPLVQGEVLAQAAGPLDEQRHRVLGRQRRQSMDQLVVEAERHLAGRQDPEAGDGVQQGPGETGDLGDDVLAVVQEEQGLGPGQALDQRRPSTRDVQGLGHDPSEVGTVGYGVQADQPGSPGQGRRLAQLAGQPGLAHPRRSHHRHQPRSPQGVGTGRPARWSGR